MAARAQNPHGYGVRRGHTKNHYGSRSLRGTQVAALFYTLCETAKLAGGDPQGYLLRALYTAIAQPDAVTYPEERLVSTPTT